MQTVIRALVLGLVDDHRNRLVEHYDTRDNQPDAYTSKQRLLDLLAGRYPMDNRYIEKLLSSEACNLVAKRQFVHMPPVWSEGSLLPVLGVNYDFTNGQMHISLQVALFRPADDVDGAPNAVGYRFESPEGPVGMHCYWHVQPIRVIRGGPGDDEQRFSLPVPAWMPVSQPAIPVDADNPVALFVSMLVSLYGDEAGVWLQQHGLVDVVKPHLAKVAFACCWTARA